MRLLYWCCCSNILDNSVFLNRCSFVPRRYRFKKKWAVNLKTTSNCQQALGNFDAFYKPYFGNDWPSIRVSLLSLPKYSAVINKYGNAEKIESQLEDLDIKNFVEYARSLQDQRAQEQSRPVLCETPHSAIASDREHEPHIQNSGDGSVSVDHIDNSSSHAAESEDQQTKSDTLATYDEEMYKENLNVFVPTEQVFSEKDQLLREEINISSFQPREIGVKMLSSEPVNISRSLDAFVFTKGDVAMFPQPKSYNRIFGYYLMDAASVMPVIALNVRPTDQVLDLCAAPGGKSFLILQCLDLYAGGTLSCNDTSPSRIARLKNVLSSYFPADIAEQVQVMKKDGTEFHLPKYTKVLVDVPCNSDRHVVTEEENNLFKISRIRERLGLMRTQKELLISAIKSCVPGGSVVYSTCTLAPGQNDGVIQAVVEELYETSEVEVAIEDLSPLAELFSHVFRFHGQTRYGQLILPNLVNNFGPSYFAKLKRLK